MAKAIGSEIVDFYLNGWPEGYYSDESIYSVMDDGRIIRGDDPDPEHTSGLLLTAVYELDDFGAIINEKSDESRGFAYFFNKWKKSKTTKSLVIEFSIVDEETIRDLLKGMRIKVIG